MVVVGQVGVCLWFEKPYNCAGIKANFVRQRPIGLDGGKIKNACAEEYTALSQLYSSQRPATFTPKWLFFMVMKGVKYDK